MAYEDKLDRKTRQVKMMLDPAIFDELKDVAKTHGLQHSVLCRDVIEGMLKAYREGEGLPYGLNR